MENLAERFERYVSCVMIVVAMLFVSYQILDLVYHFALKLVNSIQYGTFEMEEKGKPVASLFFSILLLLEIIQTIRVFAQSHTVKLKIILIVGLIAVTRKILMDDVHGAAPMDQLATAALIISLSIGYYLVNTSEKINKED
ncbi:phosphate-starvation-inducible PsiE family protein [Mucilaginibacter sp. AW1-3]